MRSIRGALAALAIGVSTALVVVALAILPFLNPLWVRFEQDRAQAGTWTGFAPQDLQAVSDAIIADLIIGPPDFDVALGGVPVLDERERQHMRDVRGVFASLYVAAAIGAAVLVAAWLLARGAAARAVFWRRLRGTGLVIAGVTVVGGIAGLLFFDTAFELFHEIFFPAGSYLFDPRTERLVQLFPQQFWVESTIAVGVVVIILGLVLSWVGGTRAARAEAVATAGPTTAIAGSVS
jgi:integral membrane protein (TIGR01906 family)